MADEDCWVTLGPLSAGRFLVRLGASRLAARGQIIQAFRLPRFVQLFAL